MAIEIERKFLVRSDRWSPVEGAGVHYRQGYLSIETNRVVRVRITGATAALTVKGRREGLSRLEFEYAIPVEDAAVMLETLCRKPLIEKRRYRQPFAGHEWEIDVFDGDNAGLITAEVELATADTRVELPPWVGREVSNDPRYANTSLIAAPFRSWDPGG